MAVSRCAAAAAVVVPECPLVLIPVHPLTLDSFEQVTGQLSACREPSVSCWLLHFGSLLVSID